MDHFWSKVDVRGPDECWEWRGALTARRGHWRSSYGVTFYQGRNTKAHRVAWVLANGRPVPEGMEVLHRCDNPPCCNPEHLFTGSHAENMADMAAKGRMDTRGERNGRALLTEDDVRAIRSVAPSRGYLYRLAAQYGVGRATIYKVHAGRSWNNVQTAD